MTDRHDLAAMLHPLVQSLIAAERPVLAAHGISMWAYAVLTALEDNAVRTQAALAEAIGADKTRIISTLDRLQDARLITRDPDPRDRRARVLTITAQGSEVCRSARADIQANEDRLLARLPASERESFLRAVRTLSQLTREEVVSGTEA
ncbi:MarR family winged helix-turn-helix transcriptional regulator [Streptosporangium sp. NPDC000396]|uniref:MarR family winged helix-turn-helix transcriptional regulator n=1 Tax=Streptosporangium sp. NPDC000396 TaxID=3366185 RepID=UPI0036CEAF0A